MEMEDPCPLPARKLARNAQRGFGFYIGLFYIGLAARAPRLRQDGAWRWLAAGYDESRSLSSSASILIARIPLRSWRHPMLARLPFRQQT
jgi:hypothetical protein